MLFENEVIQIGVKSEFRQNLGRLGLFYGNKTTQPLVVSFFTALFNMMIIFVQGFTATLHIPPEMTGKLNLQAKPVEPVVEQGTQIQQLVNAECVEDYTDSPSMNVAFTCNGAPHRLMVKLPLSLNKFFEPTEMNGDSFFARWKNLGKYVKIFQFNKKWY